MGAKVQGGWGLGCLQGPQVPPIPALPPAGLQLTLQKAQPCMEWGRGPDAQVLSSHSTRWGAFWSWEYQDETGYRVGKEGGHPAQTPQQAPGERGK